MEICIRKPGLLTTVQDLGRPGYAHLGISPGGAADPLSFRLANFLVGNQANTPALEMTLLGATLEFDAAAVVAVTGAACPVELDNQAAPRNTAIEVPAGGVLHCGNMTSGARSYLAVRGGFDVPIIMGSASTHLAGHFGGWEGRRLRAGDRIPIRCDPPISPLRTVQPNILDDLYRPGLLRVTPGPQQDWFDPEAFATLLSSAYRVSENSDRAGLRLQGKVLRPRVQAQLLTDGIPLGAIQVPQDGQPILLFVDQQTTGGYPKIANVIAADMHRVGQLRARDEVRFAQISIAEAVTALRRQQSWLQQIFGA